MSMSATHTSGFNTGSDNQNKWLLYPLYSACQHSPLKGAGGGDGRALRSDVASLGQEGGVGPSACIHGLRAARVNICFAGLGEEAWRPAEGGGHGGLAFPSLAGGCLGGQPPRGRTSSERTPARDCPAWGGSLGGLPSLPSLPILLPGLPGFAGLLGGLELGSFLLQLLCPWVGGQSADLQGGERVPSWA